MLLAWKTEDVALSQGMQAASKSRKSQGNGFSPQSLERGNRPADTLSAGPVRLIVDFRPPDL